MLRPVLAVLGAVLGADGDAQHDRHLQQAAGHRLPLGELVEDFVAGAAHEIAVHQLDQRPAAFQGVADGGADDGAFGDRRIEQPVIGQRFGQAAIDGERAAPVAVFLAVGDQRRIDVEAVEDRLEDGIADADASAAWEAVGRLRRGRAAALGELLDARILLLRVMSTSGLPSVQRLDALVREHRRLEQAAGVLQIGARRDVEVDRLLVGLEDDGVDLRLQLVDVGLRADAGVDEVLRRT